MKMTTQIDGLSYQATDRNGQPAIRKLNKAGGTALWIRLRSKIGLQVMGQLDLEPAMAPGFAQGPTHKGNEALRQEITR